ncbi:MAG: DUF4158 domain-containing protein [Terriglobia bacterium]
MADRYKDRLKILEDQEIEELYGRPQFNHDERVFYFGLSDEERALADAHYNLANRVLFILQLGYFKARTLFFSFEFDDVREDARHVLRQYYSSSNDFEFAAPNLKQTRHAQQKKILALYGYRACSSKERAALMGKASQVVHISAKPVFLFRNLLQYLESRRIVVPGYSFLQDVVSQALAAERDRLTALLEGRLTKATVVALDALYVERNGVYAATALKHDPKDFSLRETKREIARSRSLATLYGTAKTLLPKLGVSND